MEVPVYDIHASKKGSLSLPPFFEVPFNKDLIHQVVVSFDSNKRASLAHTKDRSEVRGGGKKPWKQKGTGRARHGSIRSPLWIGGGVTFGPRNEKNFQKKVNKKQRRLAFFSALSKKLTDGEVFFMEADLSSFIKTKSIITLLDSLEKIGIKKSKTARRSILFITPSQHDIFFRSINNIKGIHAVSMDTVNARDVITYKTIVIINANDSMGELENRAARGVKIQKNK